MEKMDEITARKLAALNDRFYTLFGAAFAETRRRIQPGVARVLDEYVRGGNWLDLGCGSGALGGVWIERGITGLYEGLDLSPVLIAEAQATTGKLPTAPEQKLIYAEADLSLPGWGKRTSRECYDGVLMFAAMHHIPAQARRLELLQEIAGLLSSGGMFIHSEWQFQHSPKMMSRVQPWEKAGIDAVDLEPGDTLLDWRHVSADQMDEAGLRYVHLFTHDELAELAEKSGFAITAEFSSDGASGDLSLYQVWQRS
jgi:SAM-dependent methyltransferase